MFYMKISVHCLPYRIAAYKTGMGWSFIFGLLAGSSLYALLRWMQEGASKKKKGILACEDDCFFFSPNSLLVQCTKNQTFFCKVLSCSVCNLKKFVSLIKTARSHLDVCVYLITSDELTRALLNLFSKGVFVRIILDKQMHDQAQSSKLFVFLKKHIPIKLVSTGEIMHNKFVIIDQKVLVTGSFNWTRQGTSLNYENGVIIHNEKIVRKFSMYFEEIWLK